MYNSIDKKTLLKLIKDAKIKLKDLSYKNTTDDGETSMLSAY